jgi:hypothetical protein
MLQSLAFPAEMLSRFYTLLVHYVVDLVALNLPGSRYLGYFSFATKGKCSDNIF